LLVSEVHVACNDHSFVSLNVLTKDRDIIVGDWSACVRIGRRSLRVGLSKERSRSQNEGEHNKEFDGLHLYLKSPGDVLGFAPLMKKHPSGLLWSIFATLLGHLEMKIDQ
jgi:hypothetical protein